MRRRYKALARQWHPDRHAGEARNQAEAASRMRAINAAYRCLADHLGGPGAPAASAAFLEGSAGTPSGGAMSRQELDSLVEAIGSDGPIDWLLDSLGWVGGALQALLLGLFVLACVVRLASLVSRGGSAAVLQDPTLFLFVALLALLLLRELTDRRKLHRS